MSTARRYGLSNAAGSSTLAHVLAASLLEERGPGSPLHVLYGAETDGVIELIRSSRSPVEARIPLIAVGSEMASSA